MCTKLHYYIIYIIIIYRVWSDRVLICIQIINCSDRPPYNSYTSATHTIIQTSKIAGYAINTFLLQQLRQTHHLNSKTITDMRQIAPLVITPTSVHDVINWHDNNSDSYFRRLLSILWSRIIHSCCYCVLHSPAITFVSHCHHSLACLETRGHSIKLWHLSPKLNTTSSAC
jgi:hypothetical protein